MAAFSQATRMYVYGMLDGVSCFSRGKAGLPGQRSPSSAPLHFVALLGQQGIKGMFYLFACMFLRFTASFGDCIRMLTVPCKGYAAQGSEGCLPLPSSHSQSD